MIENFMPGFKKKSTLHPQYSGNARMHGTHHYWQKSKKGGLLNTKIYDFFLLLDLSLKYISNVRFQTILAFQMSVLERLEKGNFS